MSTSSETGTVGSSMPTSSLRPNFGEMPQFEAATGAETPRRKRPIRTTLRSAIQPMIAFAAAKDGSAISSIVVPAPCSTSFSAASGSAETPKV